MEFIVKKVMAHLFSLAYNYFLMLEIPHATLKQQQADVYSTNNNIQMFTL